ncbi:MAG: hypothetical protein ACI83P_000144 [Janthinobacterium sp.]
MVESEQNITRCCIFETRGAWWRAVSYSASASAAVNKTSEIMLKINENSIFCGASFSHDARFANVASLCFVVID